MYAPYSEEFMKKLNEPRWMRKFCSKRCSYLQYWNTGITIGQGFLGLEKYVIHVKESAKPMTLERLFIKDK